MSNLVSVRDLRVSFRLGKTRVVEAVRGVSFEVPENATVALVGESGSGKSVSAMSIVRLLPDNAIVDRASRIEFAGANLLAAPIEQLRRIRGKDISVVFQEPMSSLNPAHRRHADQRGTAAAPEALGPAGDRSGHRAADGGGHPGAEGTRRCLSARTVRRSAAAGDDRHGDRLRAEAADRR